jgi:lysozyme family protein
LDLKKNSKMANFDKAAKRVLKIEGDFQNWANDKGNYNANGQRTGTNHGVSSATYEWYTGELATIEKMRAITKTFAKAVFRKLFWNRILGDRIENQYVAEIFFDGVVNHGRGIHLMQQVLNVKQDGIVGEITLGAINKSKPAEIYTSYKAVRNKYYHQLVENDKSQKDFLKGWMVRLDEFQDYIVEDKGLDEFQDYIVEDKGVMTGIAVLVGVFFSLIT